MYVYTGLLLGSAVCVCERGIRTFLVLQATASEIDHLDGTFRGMFKQHILRKINTRKRWGRRIVPLASDHNERCGGASSEIMTLASGS